MYVSCVIGGQFIPTQLWWYKVFLFIHGYIAFDWATFIPTTYDINTHYQLHVARQGKVLGQWFDPLRSFNNDSLVEDRLMID